MTTIIWICFGLAGALSILATVLAVALMRVRRELDAERLKYGALSWELLATRRELADFRFPNGAQREMVDA